MSEYLVVQHCEDARAWRSGPARGVPDEFRLGLGVRLAPDYPERVVLDLHPSSGSMKVDFLRNTEGLIIAGPRARALLLASGVSEEDVELLPVLIRDRKGRILEEPFSIVNPIVNVRCMDRKRSEFETYSNSDEAVGVSRLFVTPDHIPGHLVLFRLGEYPELKLVRGDLLKAIETAGLTGFRAVPQGAALI